MHSLSWTVAAALVTTLLGCAQEAPVERPGQVTDTPAPQAIIADSAPVAPPAAPQVESASPLVGNWQLRPAAPLRRGPGGIQMTLTIDSARAERVFGRLAHYFAGNVGLDPAGFQPFEGTLTDGAVAITLEHTDPAGPSIGFAGELSGDTVHLETFALGPDTLSRYANWVLVRYR
jgi:hypothetical protein